MRQFTILEAKRLAVFTKYGIEVTALEPTANGLQKSILDATGPVRSFFINQKIHDYGAQLQGTLSKVILNAYFVTAASLIPSAASLYRPETKKGDPRIWFKGLPTFSNPHDIIVIFNYDNALYLINITQLDVEGLVGAIIKNPLQDLVIEINKQVNSVADELLQLLVAIGRKGPIQALLNADTAIGRTLETLLGIDINSSKKPDYKGIELKAYRDKRGNRKNLFAQVPDWKISKFKSSAEILSNFGYARGEDFKLYCTVSTKSRNSQGLQLNVDQLASLLHENSRQANTGNFISWPMDTLHQRLVEKHNETFWIGANSTHVDGNEFLHYNKVEHTSKPILSQFDILLDQGYITLDHLIKKEPSGKVVEKGPLFKIKPAALALLFPPSKIYSLV
ncbi:MvaI/BcnI family restriction endonuclease [Mucilaginibacter sp. Mucisp84]|uniref:MvaI/BcnI family restriction endonuclease n=1 Tax=Mucilaginibacter sp. Mucisp84 TaxID=3243058 RepID=UPI0039A56821